VYKRQLLYLPLFFTSLSLPHLLLSPFPLPSFPPSLSLTLPPSLTFPSSLPRLPRLFPSLSLFSQILYIIFSFITSFALVYHLYFCDHYDRLWII
jgi:hypothetical protein